ncbi:helix-turn-helix domain-containing protein [Umezawaea tangerina]|uniref:Helix-turn-helix protein n=1 Tax=Umezawaea tangerina TaxID=84725 RepID=A0A2T0TCD5_9PSEU|nr:helix-turn-helix transcriptional regulator [Umezawaea tangerina]PRY43319.1 helix-turn-helix protein [Umezawaea tangerina]
MSATPVSGWWPFVRDQLDQKNWNGADFQRASGISRSRLVSWEDGAAPTLDLIRTTADAFEVPVVTAYVAAGLLTAADLEVPAPLPVDLTAVGHGALLRELERRLT